MLTLETHFEHPDCAVSRAGYFVRVFADVWGLTNDNRVFALEDVHPRRIIFEHADDPASLADIRDTARYLASDGWVLSQVREIRD